MAGGDWEWEQEGEGVGVARRLIGEQGTDSRQTRRRILKVGGLGGTQAWNEGKGGRQSAKDRGLHETFLRML